MQRCVLGLIGIWAALTVAAAEPAGPDAAEGLFVDVPAPKLKVTVRPTISRRRVVTVDPTMLRRSKAAGARLPLNFFADARFEGIVEQVIERGDDDFTLLGSLAGRALSSFALTVKNGTAVMNVRTPGGGMFHLRHLGNSFYDVRQIDESKFPPCGTTQRHEVNLAPAKTPPAAPKTIPKSDSGATIDVLVVYTPASREAAGGVSAMEALINLAIDEANVAFQRSQITPRLRLVYQQEVNYTESSSFDLDLNRLTRPEDGYLDEVHALRDTYGADLVCLLIDSSEYCGLGWLMGTLSHDFENFAFSTVAWDCATGYYSFAHELAHNMGCAHDRENANGVGLYPYSYGWRFVTPNNVTNRTVMAYSPGTRIQNFSNPDVLYNGVATGVPTNQPDAANNALTINSSAYTVANWRQSSVGCTFSLASFSTNVSSADATGLVAVFTQTNCAWTASSQSPFITLPAVTNGLGNGPLLWRIETNSSSLARTGTVLVAGLIFTVVQNGSGPSITLPVALESPDAIWSTAGSADWTGEDTTTHDGVDAARSGHISNDQQSYVETVAFGPGPLTFWWKVSSETNYDFLRVLVDGMTNQSISGEVDWRFTTLNLTSGVHTVRWSYAKDFSLSKGQDTAWLDEVQLPARAFFRPDAVAFSSNMMRMELRGEPSFSVIVQASTNLIQWSSVATGMFNPSGQWTCTNMVPGIPRRFYRALIP